MSDASATPAPAAAPAAGASPAPAAAPSPAPATSDAEATPASPQHAARLRMRAVAREVLGKEVAPPAAPAAPVPSPAAQAAPSAQAAEAVTRIEQAGGVAPEQRAGESDKAFETRLNTALQALARSESERETQRKRGDTAEARAAELEGRTKELQGIVDGARGNVELALELAGVTPDEVARMLLEGKLKRGKYAHLPPEIRTRLETLERKEAEREREVKSKAEAEAKAAKDREDREADLVAVEQEMATLGTQYVLPASMPRAKERILDSLYAEIAAGADPKHLDIGKTVERLQAGLLEDTTALLSNESVVKLLCSNPVVRDTVAKVLGLSVPAREQSPQASPASDDRGKQPTGEGPRTLSQHVASEVPDRKPAPVTEKERQARIRAAGRAVLRGA